MWFKMLGSAGGVVGLLLAVSSMSYADAASSQAALPSLQPAKAQIVSPASGLVAPQPIERKAEKASPVTNIRPAIRTAQPAAKPAAAVTVKPVAVTVKPVVSVAPAAKETVTVTVVDGSNAMSLDRLRRESARFPDSGMANRFVEISTELPPLIGTDD